MIEISIWKIISIVGYSLGAIGLVTAIVMYYKLNIKAVYEDVTGKTAKRKLQELIEREQLEREERILIKDYDPKNANTPEQAIKFNSGELKSDTAQFSAVAQRVAVEKTKSFYDATQAEGTTVLQNDVHISSQEETTLLESSQSINQELPETTVLHDDFNRKVSVQNAAEGTNASLETTVLQQVNTNEPLQGTTVLIDKSEEITSLNPTENTGFQDNSPIATTVLNESINETTVLQPNNLVLNNDGFVQGTTILSDSTMSNTAFSNKKDEQTFYFDIKKSRMIVYKRESIGGDF